MITICTRDILPLFNNHNFTMECIRILNDFCKQYKFELYCYCFMPDHVHFIASVHGHHSIFDLVAMFKSLTTKKSREFDCKDSIYQSRFYDHFIRSEKELNEKINYILENPVRKGIVENWSEYPFSSNNITGN